MSRLKSRLQTPEKEKGFGYYEFPLFFFLLITSLGLMPNRLLDANAMTVYLISYRLGLQSRALVGTVFFLFTDKITSRQIYVVSVIALMLLLMLIAILLGVFIRRSPYEVRSSVEIFALLFVAAPWSITYLTGLNFGSFDTYLFIIALLIVVFLKSPYLRWGIPVLTLLAMAIHQGFFFSFFLALAILILYEAYQNHTNDRSIAGYILFFVTCLTSLALFFTFQYLQTPLPFSNVNEFVDYLSDYADFELSYAMLDSLYFVSFSEYYRGFVQPVMKLYALPFALTILAFSLPLIVLFVYFWKNTIKSAESIVLRLIFLLSALASLVFLPVTYLLNDWDRYGSIIMSCQFILAFYFIYSRVPGALEVTQKIGQFFQEHPIILFLLLIFFSSIKFAVVTTDFSAYANLDTAKEVIFKYYESRKFDHFLM